MEQVTVDNGIQYWEGAEWVSVRQDAPDASEVPFTPAGGITATDVQAAIEELDTAFGDVLVPADIGVTVQGFDADTAKLDVAQSFTAEQTFKEFKETQYSLTGTLIDPANGTLQYKTLSSNTTFSESIQNGQSVTLMLNDGSSRTASWPTIKWVGGSAPTLPTSGYAVIELWQINGVLYGMHSGDVYCLQSIH